MPLDLLPFQIVGADHLASRHRAALFDDMGVGKTAQAIGALDRIGAKRVLIVCPAAVQSVWCGKYGEGGELKKFSTIPRRVLKGKDIQDLNLWLRGRCDVLVLSYERATNWAKRLEGDLIDAIIFDESHRMKNKEAIRTRALLGHDCDGKHGLARWGVNVWFLSGSPSPNDPSDVWSIMRFCGATPLTQRIFRDRYFKKRVGTYSTSHIPREEMLPEIKQAIKSFSLRRTSKEAGLNLPPIWVTTSEVDGDAAHVRAILEGHPGLEEAIKEAVAKGGLSFLDAPHIATLRRLVGEAKAPAYVDQLAGEFADGRGKTVIGAIHTKAIELVRQGLEDRGIKAVVFNGPVSDRKRDDAVAAWRDDPDLMAFIGNIDSAGEGQTLIAGHDVDMFESAWAPFPNLQFIKRTHRIGQERSVHARFITLANSIDVYVSETVARKTAAIARTGFQSMVA